MVTFRPEGSTMVRLESPVGEVSGLLHPALELTALLSDSFIIFRYPYQQNGRRPDMVGKPSAYRPLQVSIPPLQMAACAGALFRAPTRRQRCETLDLPPRYLTPLPVLKGSGPQS
jgi:hypothetical protein